MLKTVFIMADGLVAAFDYEAHQVAEAQGELVDFYYQWMKERGLADERTEFNWHANGVRQATGADLDKRWRTSEEGPTVEG